MAWRILDLTTLAPVRLAGREPTYRERLHNDLHNNAGLSHYAPRLKQKSLFSTLLRPSRIKTLIVHINQIFSDEKTDIQCYNAQDI